MKGRPLQVFITALLLIFCRNVFAKDENIKYEKNDFFASADKPPSFSFGNNQIDANKALRNKLKSAHEIRAVSKKTFLISGINYAWLSIKYASKPNSFGKGYCGAGTEDFLFLLKAQNRKLYYIGDYKIQSCLENFELDEVADIKLDDDGQLTVRQNKIVDGVSRTSEVVIKPRENRIDASVIKEDVEILR